MSDGYRWSFLTTNIPERKADRLRLWTNTEENLSSRFIHAFLLWYSLDFYLPSIVDSAFRILAKVILVYVTSQSVDYLKLRNIEWEHDW